MATIRKRGDKWQAQIRRDNAPPISKSFRLKEDALKWCRQQELAFDRGEYEAPLEALKDVLLTLLERYEATITPTKRSAHSEGYHLRQIKGHPIAKIQLAKLTPANVAKFRDDRLANVANATVRKELTLLGSVLKLAKLEWGYAMKTNPVSDVRKPPNGRPRDRRLNDGDLPNLLKALDRCRNPLIKEVFLFSLATGMRRGEVLSLTWPNTDLQRKIALLPITKNGESRVVPLSPAALDVLAKRKLQVPTKEPLNIPHPPSNLIFPISVNGFCMAWKRVKERAGIIDFHFHDLRHEAISRFFELGLSVPEVSLISGHKDTRMLFRYTHLKAEDVAKKLAQL